MHLIQIPAGEQNGVSPLEKLWPVVEPMLEKAVEFSGGITTLIHEYADLRANRKQLWVVVQDEEKPSRIVAAGITSLQRHPGGLFSANIELFGGENMKAWFELKDQFEDWAKKEGCSEVRLVARKGWAKHLSDYRLTNYMMSKQLND